MKKTQHEAPVTYAYIQLRTNSTVAAWGPRCCSPAAAAVPLVVDMNEQEQPRPRRTCESLYRSRDESDVQPVADNLANRQQTVGISTAAAARKRNAAGLASHDLGLSDLDSEYEEAEEDDIGSSSDEEPANHRGRAHANSTAGRAAGRARGNQGKPKTGLSAAAAPRARVSVAR